MIPSCMLVTAIICKQNVVPCGYVNYDPKHRTTNLLKGGKWLSEKKWGTSVNEVTLRLEKVYEISAIDVGNSGSAFISIEVSRMGLQRFETLLPSTSLMSAKDCKLKENWTCVKMFTTEDFSPSVREHKWDLMRITCLQPFLKDVQFGISFIKVFSNLMSVVEEIDVPSSSRSLLRTRQPEIIEGVCLPMSRSEKIVQKVTGYLQNQIEDSSIASQISKCNDVFCDREEAKKNTFSFQENLYRFQSRVLNDNNLSNSSKLSPTVAKKKKCLQLLTPNPLNNSTKLSSNECKRECTSDSDSDTTVILPPQKMPPQKMNMVLVRSPKSLPSSSESTLEKESKKGHFTKGSTDNVGSKLPFPSSPKSISSDVTDIILEGSDSSDDVPRQRECPLCLEKFDVSKIEEHAANCCIVVEPEDITNCPICGKHFPPKVLEQHADLCADRVNEV